MRQVRVGVDDSIAEGLDNLRLNLIGQVAERLRRVQLAPAVVDFLFLGQGVGDAGEEAKVGLKRLRQRRRARRAFFAVGVREQVQRLLGVHLFAVDVKGQAGHRLIKQAVPG